MKLNVRLVLIAMTAGVLGAWLFDTFKSTPSITVASEVDPGMEYQVDNAYRQAHGDLPEVDFVEASKSSTESVVYIRNISTAGYQVSWMDLFFGGEPNQEVRVSSGSGVIFSEDGYIVTNNHVIEDADKVEVIYAKKTFEAELVGTDPSTDLAVLKIEAEQLPAIPLGSSQNLQVGQWVIAVGNPFNLTSTVTAGIVSAKGRQINILKEKFPIESFIQTDAAINPGNSGGALVDESGKLVGINTAILSRTGSYAGYGFAVPSDIVQKVFHDLVKYGEVQKAFFGGEVEDFNSEIADRFDIDSKDNFDGVLLVYLQNDGAASEAGLEEGDVILALDGSPIDSRSAFEERLSYHSPGDKLNVRYRRKGRETNTELVLTNREGTTDILKREILQSDYLGADFEAVPKVEKDVLGIEQGIRIFNIGRGRLSGMAEEFIVTHINGTPVQKADKLIDILENIDGVVWIEGVDKNGRRGRYRFYGR